MEWNAISRSPLCLDKDATLLESSYHGQQMVLIWSCNEMEKMCLLRWHIPGSWWDQVVGDKETPNLAARFN